MRMFRKPFVLISKMKVAEWIHFTVLSWMTNSTSAVEQLIIVMFFLTCFLLTVNCRNCRPELSIFSMCLAFISIKFLFSWFLLKLNCNSIFVLAHLLLNNSLHIANKLFIINLFIDYLFILVVPMFKCLEEHWCMSWTLNIAILNGTCFLGRKNCPCFGWCVKN